MKWSTGCPVFLSFLTPRPVISFDSIPLHPLHFIRNYEAEIENVDDDNHDYDDDDDDNDSCRNGNSNSKRNRYSTSINPAATRKPIMAPERVGPLYWNNSVIINVYDA